MYRNCLNHDSWRFVNHDDEIVAKENMACTEKPHRHRHVPNQGKLPDSQCPMPSRICGNSHTNCAKRTVEVWPTHMKISHNFVNMMNIQETSRSCSGWWFALSCCTLPFKECFQLAHLWDWLKAPTCYAAASFGAKVTSLSATSISSGKKEELGPCSK